MAKKVKENVYSGGIEGRLSRLGEFFLNVGLIGLFACIFVSGFVTKTSTYSDWGEDGISPIWIAFSIICLLQGIALNIILKAIAEVVRLLKKLNGLKFGGKISEPKMEYKLICSECGNHVYGDETKCDKCKKEFEKD